MTYASRVILQTRSVTGGDFSCKRQLETPLRCKLQENIASCDMTFNVLLICFLTQVHRNTDKMTCEIATLLLLY